MKKENCKKCGSDNIVMVEYSLDSPEYYDGVSEIKCMNCGVSIGRWSGKELADGEVEKKYGQSYMYKKYLSIFDDNK